VPDAGLFTPEPGGQAGAGASRARRAPARAAPKPGPQPAAERPVARVCVDVPLAHLDRPFDYLVPERADAQARPGVRVRVRFAGQLVDGYLLDRVDASAHPGRLAYLERVVSAEPVLHPEVAELARAVADRYAGTLADVLRLAVPPRHARAEASAWPPVGGPPDPRPHWDRYPAGDAYLRVRVKPHPFFTRDGDDLRVDLPVAMHEALLGGEVTVPTLKGRVSLRIPPETQNGRTIRLAGQGMPRAGGGHGDLYSTVKVVMPTKLSEKERELAREVATSRSGENVRSHLL